MKIAAVIAEYNPFHTGHLYQLSQIREANDIDYIIIMMSGDFVQRGAPAIMNKYIRSQMALSCGADLVLELPVSYTLGSAEYFAHGAVSLLNSLGVVNILHFGSECGDIDILNLLATLFAEQPDSYSDSIASLLKDGLSFPVARAKASIQYFQQNKTLKISEDALQAILSSPNNVLGIEYCKAIARLNSKIEPHTISRAGAQYHEKQIHDSQKYPSATAIRKVLSQGTHDEQLKALLPSSVLKIYQKEHPVLLTENDFSTMLHYKLLMQKDRDYTEYLDVTPDLSNRIAKTLQQFTTFDNFCMLLKSKNYTYTRICRCMFHILLDIHQYNIDAKPDSQMPHFVRMLGFRKEAAPLLSEIKKNSDIILLSKLTNYEKVLTPEDQTKLQTDLNAYNVYQSAVTAKTGTAAISEFTRPIIPY